MSSKGIRNKRIGLHRLTKQKAHLVRYIALFIPELFALYKLFKKEYVDIVHCNGSWQIKGIIAGVLSGAKVVWFLNDTQMPLLLRMIFRLLALICCDAFIANGNRVKKYYLDDLRLLSIPFEVIQSPVDTSVFDPENVKEDQKIADYPELKIVTVANINPIKGIEYFIEMASILNGLYDNLSFFVVGSQLANQKSYTDKIFGLIKKYGLENLHFYCSSDNIPSVLKAADFYVCSSIAEASLKDRFRNRSKIGNIDDEFCNKLSVSGKELKAEFKFVEPSCAYRFKLSCFTIQGRSACPWLVYQELRC